MKLIWAIYENEYKPRMFDAENLKGMPDDLLVSENGKTKRAKVISSSFSLSERDANAILNWYGLTDFPQIIGTFEYKEVLFNEAELRD